MTAQRPFFGMSKLDDGRAAASTLSFVALLTLAACVDEADPGAAPASSPGDGDGAATSADLAAAAEGARTAIESYVEAVNAMDLDSAGSFYSDARDFQWIEEGAVRYGSAEESRESLAGLGAMASATRLTLSDLAVTALGSAAAVATCHFAQEIDVGGGRGFSFSGAMTIVLRRERGRWLFVSGHTSSIRPRPDEAADSARGARP